MNVSQLSFTCFISFSLCSWNIHRNKRKTRCLFPLRLTVNRRLAQQASDPSYPATLVTLGINVLRKELESNAEIYRICSHLFTCVQNISNFHCKFILRNDSDRHVGSAILGILLTQGESVVFVCLSTARLSYQYIKQALLNHTVNRRVNGYRSLFIGILFARVLLGVTYISERADADDKCPSVCCLPFH